MSATHKIVNGESVPLTPEEIAAIEAEWLANTPLGEAEQQAADAQARRDQAKKVYDEVMADMEALAQAARALALITMDEINLLRQWVADFKGQVAAASSLADLKTRVAALPNTPDRTTTQLKQAIRNRIDAGV